MPGSRIPSATHTWRLRTCRHRCRLAGQPRARHRLGAAATGQPDSRPRVVFIRIHVRYVSLSEAHSIWERGKAKTRHLLPMRFSGRAHAGAEQAREPTGAPLEFSARKGRQRGNATRLSEREPGWPTHPDTRGSEADGLAEAGEAQMAGPEYRVGEAWLTQCRLFRSGPVYAIRHLL